MRIAVGGFNHETNTFSNIHMNGETLKRNRLGAGAYYMYSEGVRTDSGGYIDACRELGIELIPTAQYNLVPCGPTQREAFEEVRDEIVKLMWQAHQEAPLDAIILKMHGAGVAEGYPDLEAELLRAVRERFGNDIPVGMSLDLHANYSPEMLTLSDATVGYKCYPHVDAYEAGYKLIYLLHRCITGKKPGKAMVKLPLMVLPAYGLTTSGTAHDIQSLLYKMMETEPGLLELNFFHGFAYADIPAVGASVVALAEDEETAQRCADQLARYAWSHRYDLQIPIHSAKEAMDLAVQAEGVAVINESSDNPGGGTPGDGTHLLREMLERNIPGSAYGFIYDPEIVEMAFRAGVGGAVSGLLGGKQHPLHGKPIELRDAYVKTLSDGKFIHKNPMGKGGIGNYRGLACLVVGNVHIVVCGQRTQTMDDAPFYMAGLDWRNMRILALKSTHHFKGWWADQVKTIISCDSPGVHSADLSGFTFTGVAREYFPLADPVWN